MEKKRNLSTGAIIGIVVLAALSVAELIINYVCSIQIYSIAAMLFELVPYTFLFIAIAYYAAAGYKKPHGDLLRAVFLVFSFSCFGTIVSQVAFEGSVGTVSFVIFMGVFRIGSLIKYIPYTITTGFTAGIAVTIAIGPGRRGEYRSRWLLYEL